MLAIRVSLSSIDKVLGDGYSVEMQVERLLVKRETN